MRTIKFRVWSDVWRELMFAISIDFNNKFVEVLPESELEGGSTQLVSFDQIHIMQFTGLHDKNGVEIYEGDITNDGYVIKWSDKKALFCEFYKNTFSGEWKEASYPMSVDQIIIIGNIYTNPDLLEERAKV